MRIIYQDGLLAMLNTNSWNFSKVSSLLNVPSQITVESIFENMYKTDSSLCSTVTNFSKDSSLLNVLCQITIELIVENFFHTDPSQSSTASFSKVSSLRIVLYKITRELNLRNFIRRITQQQRISQKTARS